MVGNGIQEGLSAAAGGIGFIVGTPAMWPWALVPVAVLLLLTCGLGWLAVWAAGEASASLVGVPAGFWGEVGAWAAYVALVTSALFLALLVSFALAQPLSGFALEKITLAQERALVGHAAANVSFLRANIASLKAAVLALPVAVGVLGTLFAIGLLFPPAVVITVPLKVLVGGWLLAWNFVDYPLSMRGLGIRARVRWVARHFGAFTSFGLFWALLLPIPGAFLLALPMGVAGAARLVVDSDRADP